MAAVWMVCLLASDTKVTASLRPKLPEKNRCLLVRVVWSTNALACRALNTALGALALAQRWQRAAELFAAEKAPQQGAYHALLSHLARTELYNRILSRCGLQTESSE